MKERKMKLRKGKGFTLVELVIVIAIVIVLSVVSVPIYRNYVDKAKMTEGYALLGTILTAQKAYYSEYGNFLDMKDTANGDDAWTSYEPKLGVDARGNKYFTFFFVAGNNGTGKTYFSAAAMKPGELRENEFSTLKLRFYTTSGATYLEENNDIE